MSVTLSTAEQQLLHSVRAAADDLARLIHQAADAGFTIQFNINGQIGACDIFNAYKMVQVDLRAGAN